MIRNFTADTLDPALSFPEMQKGLRSKGLNIDLSLGITYLYSNSLR
jgi:hypothetical protein